MEQLRVIVKALWQQRFWLLTLFCIITAVFCWSSAAGTISDQFNKNKSSINQRFTAMSSLSSQASYPNEEVNKQDEDQTRVQRDYVKKIWEDLYGKQRERVLKWPDDEVLGSEFAEKIEGKLFLDPIESSMRGLYWNYIEKQFDALLEVVDAADSSDGRSGRGRGFGAEGGFGEEALGGVGGRPGRGASDEEDEHLVEWTDQDKARKKLSFKSRPSSTQIWITQEDLWVYETLLKVIADTNEARGATRPDNTAVREIVTLEIGSDTARNKNSRANIIIPSGGVGGGGAAGAYGEYGGGGGRGGFSERGIGPGAGYGDGGYGEGIGPGGADGVSDEELLAERYVDETGAPLSGSPDELTAEFRRLPVQMRLQMDQRWIPRLLLECANAPLPVVVERVRVNPDLSGVGFGSQSGNSTSSRRKSGSGKQNKLADVAIQGVVFIYNPPSADVLSLPGDELDGQLSDAGGL